MKIKLLLALFVVQLGFAQQRTCGTKEYMQNMLANPELRQQYLDLQQQFESELQRLELLQHSRNAQGVNAPNVTIRIPVAVHFPSVTATSGNASLRDCLKLLAQRQVNILNADYNATNSDITLWQAASEFYPGVNVGDMDVSFEIATQNHPTGSGLGFPTNGQPAVTFGTDFLSNADSDSTWAGYCNLVVRNIANGILGYSPLGGSPSAGMTVVIDNNAFGATMTGSPATCSGYVPSAPYNLGRTLTHELGHFFNLDHTFDACDAGNCATSGDRVCDTPPADTPYFDCDAPGTVFTNCGATQLTMNYMDYVQDACMYMFTVGQATRMTAWYNTIASQLETNVLANNDFVTSNFSIAPNPNKGTFAIQLKEATDSYSVIIIDALGREIYNTDFNQTTDLVQNIQIDTTLSGLYYVTIQSNGATITKKILVE